MGLSNFLAPIPKSLDPQPMAVSVPPAPVAVNGLAFLKARAQVAFEEKYPEEISEIKRICGLVAHHRIQPEELEAVCANELLAGAYNSGFRLHPEQAELLLGFDENAPDGIGCFGPIGCGRGKTLATQMLAERGLKRGIERSVLLIPAQVYTQFYDDLRWAHTKVPLRTWFHKLGGIDVESRRALVKSRKPGCYVLTYELLSQAEQAELLELIEPGLIICDEAHNLARRDSTRTKRYLQYVEEREPVCVAFSGTMTGKSIKDYWHIIKVCLRLKSPLPVAKNLMEEWAMVLDSDAEPSKAQALKLRLLVQWARGTFPRCLTCHGSGKRINPEDKAIGTCKSCKGSGQNLFTDDVAGYRKAYTLRLNSSPGVVSSPDDVVGTGLLFANQPVQTPEASEGWSTLTALIKQVEDEYITPGGEDIAHAIHCYKWLYELSAGFYNELFWPEVAVFAKRRKIQESQAQEILDKAKKYEEAKALFTKELRYWLGNYSRPKLDSPLLVTGFLASKGAPPNGDDLLYYWELKQRLDFEGRPERDSRAVRICPYKIDAAAAWARELKGEGGIVWIHNEEIGDWVTERMLESGLDVLHCPAGANDEIRDTRNAHRIVVASIKAHGTGKNLQHFWNQFVLQWPRGAIQAEQMIARTHREGQKKDSLTVTMSNTTSFDHANFAACLNDALYIHQTGGGQQRLVYGRHVPLPKIYPSEWLRERGFEVDMLGKEQAAVMQEKFSPAFMAS